MIIIRMSFLPFYMLNSICILIKKEDRKIQPPIGTALLHPILPYVMSLSMPHSTSIACSVYTRMYVPTFSNIAMHISVYVGRQIHGKQKPTLNRAHESVPPKRKLIKKNFIF